MNEIEVKVRHILQLFNEGLKVEEVAPKVGYSHPKSLSRFMAQQGYRWDTISMNYVLNASSAPLISRYKYFQLLQKEIDERDSFKGVNNAKLRIF
ncbi:hypothetical protein M1K46_02310 [Fictibacillus sp. WQ 8-8]|uniref:hypothetical protein n=1 Tax=Fictibacillus sp. WQ 8-8 TaxID=2938788 RepID=UPI00210E3F27|nr:hypothetical protein [Fictibacillus sp. WQ 8-8]MCQ6264499.1 hypothetical protein [Fictibacillus sp. WQ 8-8]